MSKIFYDHITDLSEVERRVKDIAHTQEEREELYRLIDEILHHRVLGAVLSKLPESHHKEFLDRFTNKPHDSNILLFLSEKIKEDVEEFIRQEVHDLVVELLLIVEGRTAKKSSKKKK